MINIGDNEISGIYLGNSEISAIYAGDNQIYPMNLGTLTGIAIENLEWVKDIPASGGTATSANCSFNVYAYYDSGRRKRVTKDATITGSLVVPATTAETREMVGTLTLTASYSGFTDSDTVDVYQAKYFVGPVSITMNRTYFDLQYSGTSNTKMHIVFIPHTGGASLEQSGNDKRNAYPFGRSYTGQRTQLSINCYYQSTGATETHFNFRFYAGSSYNDNFIMNMNTETVYDATLSTTGVSISSGGTVINSTTYNNTYQTSSLFLGNGGVYAGVWTIFEFQIYENDVLVKDYIPWEDNGYGCIKETISDIIINAANPSNCIPNYD